MAQESSGTACVQIVFLVDESSTEFHNETQVNEAANSIRLSALRLLSYFNDKQIQNHGNIRWGFKFYNSKSLKQRYVRHDFKEFCVSSFEEFENDVCCRLEDVFQKTERTQHDSNVDGNEIQGKTSSAKVTAARCLTCALTDLIHDFQWENMDIYSPVRKTRQSNVHNEIRRTRNIVFLLSCCPVNFSDLDRFCGSEIRSFEGLRDSLMSAALLREFCSVYRIALHWIDTTSNWRNNHNTEVECRSVIEQFLNMLNGRLIPLPSLVNVHVLSSLKSSSGLVVPFMSIMAHYMESDEGYEAMDVTSYPRGLDSRNDRLWNGCLCSPGTNKVHCEVRFSPMFSSLASQSKDIQMQYHQSVSSQMTVNYNATRTTTCPEVMVVNEEEREPTPNFIWIKGVTRREKVCPTWFHETKVYSCIGMATQEVIDSDRQLDAVSCWYQNLMLTLAKQNLLLVVEMLDPQSRLPVLSVLQPLTSTCGIVSAVNNQMLTAMEKLLLWRGQQTSIQENIEKLKQLEMPGNSGQREKADMTHGEASCIVETSSAGKASRFAAQDLDVWGLGLSCTQTVPQELHKLTTSSTDAADVIKESALMKDLKELYDNKATTIPKISAEVPTKPKSSRSAEPSTHSVSMESKEILNKEQKSISSVSVIKSSDVGEEQDKKHLEELISSLEKGREDCIPYLKNLYERALAGGIELLDYIDQTMAVVKWKVEKLSNEECSVESLLSNNLLLDNNAIRAEYDGQDGLLTKDRKTKEYQVQVILRMELALLLEEPEADSSLVNEIVVMMRAISFAKDPGFLRDFMHEIVLPRYAKHISKFLCEVYEGLMQNPPRMLLSPSQLSDDESPLKRCNPSSISRPESDQPRSSGGRPITRHRSVADAGGRRRREIVIPARTKPKASKKKKEKKATRPDSARKIRNEKAKVQKTPVKKVRRNLFTGEEEEEEGGAGSAKNLKVPGIFAKEPKPKHKFSRRHSVAACSSKVVQETPARKQLSHALWQKQHRARKRTSTVTDLNVVQESPLKDIQAAENLPRRSPRRHPSTSFQRSTSFYGGGAAASCPLKRTRSFTTSTSSDSPMKKMKLDLDEEQDSTQEKLNDAPGKSHTLAAPVEVSPIRFSPAGKRKKFSLHALLSRPVEPCSPHRKKKPTTPKHDRVQGVRSSPRLLKRRSFSCIGFTNAAPLGGLSSKSNSDVCRSTIAGSTSEEPPACIASESMDGLPGAADSDINSTMPQPSGAITPSRKLRKALLQSPRRSSPRLNRTHDFKCQTNKENSGPNIVPSGTPPQVENNSTGVKLDTIVDEAPLAAAEAAASAAADFEIKTRGTPRRRLLQSPPRSSVVNQKQGLDSDDEITFRSEVPTTPVRSARMLVASSPKLQIKLHPIERTSPLRNPVVVNIEADSNEGSSAGGSSPGKGVQECSPSSVKRKRLRVLLSDAKCGSVEALDGGESSMFDDDEGSEVEGSDETALNNIIGNILKSDEESEASSTMPCKPVRLKPSEGHSRSLTRSHSSDIVVLLSPIKGSDAVAKEVHDVAMETTHEVTMETNHIVNKSFDSAIQATGGHEGRVTLNAGRQRTRSLSPRHGKTPRSLGRLTRTTSKEFPAPKTEDLRIELYDLRVGEKECKDEKEGESADPIPCRPVGTVGIATSSHGDLLETRDVSALKPVEASPTRTSPRKSSSVVRNQNGSQQRLLVAKPSLSTPPSKKPKKSRSISGSPADGKRSSPINQMLKQRKRHRSDTGNTVSNKDQVKTVFGPNPLKRPSPAKKSKKSLSTKKKGKPRTKGLVIQPPELLDECSKSSEDMFDDWLTDIDIHRHSELPIVSDEVDPTKRHKSLVFGKASEKKFATSRKTPKTSLDSSFEEDNDEGVFQSPSDFVRRRKNPIKATTPISTNSLKVLQESPLLFSKINALHRPSPSSLSKNWAEYSPSKETRQRRTRLARRKRSDAFGELSSEGEHESSMNESIGSDSATEPDDDRFPRLRKRLKIMSN